MGKKLAKMLFRLQMVVGVIAVALGGFLGLALMTEPYLQHFDGAQQAKLACLSAIVLGLLLILNAIMYFRLLKRYEKYEPNATQSIDAPSRKSETSNKVSVPHERHNPVHAPFGRNAF
jgi:hypothetical protein